MLELRNVTRLNSGVYECSSFDVHTYDEISANTTVFVNCKDSRMTGSIDPHATQRCQTGHASCELPLSVLCVDLDPAVVEPEDSNVVAQGGELKATCNALSSLQTHAVWFKVTHVHTAQHSHMHSY